MQGLLDGLPGVLMVIDGGGTVRYTAGQLDKLGGRTYAQLVGSQLSDYVDPDERSEAENLIAHTTAMPAGDLIGPVRITYLDVDGSRRLTQVWGMNKSEDPSIGGVLLLFLPETAYDRFDQVLASVVRGGSIDEIFGSLAEALRHAPVAGECFFVMPGRDDRGVVRCPDLAEVPGPPMAGPWDDIFAGASSVEHTNLSRLPSVVRELAREAGFSAVSCFAVHPGLEGRADACLVVWSRHEGALLPYARRAVDRAVVVASLAMSHRSEEEGLRDAAFRDALTGLGNRRSFFLALEEQVTAGGRPAILYIDLDGFKLVNDRLGHLAGDAVLRVAARRLSSVMRPTDELARLGGDEFAVLCNGEPNADQMVMIAERVVEQLSQPLTVGDGETVDIGASVGIALEFVVGTPADTILGRADHALFDAKAKGRSQWSIVTGE